MAFFAPPVIRRQYRSRAKKKGFLHRAIAGGLSGGRRLDAGFPRGAAVPSARRTRLRYPGRGACGEAGPFNWRAFTTSAGLLEERLPPEWPIT